MDRKESKRGDNSIIRLARWVDVLDERLFSSSLDLNDGFSRRIRSSAYLFTLALIDVFFLLDLLPGMIHTAFVGNLYRKAKLICYMQTYISFVASFVHIWMVLAFTAERFFAVNFPLKHMSQCTPNLSRGVILIIIVPAFLFYIHPAFFVSEVDNRGQCREKPDYERYMHYLNIIDTIMTMFLPFIVVSILNILIIRKLFCSKTFRQHVFANGSRYQCRRTSQWAKTSSSAAAQAMASSSSTPSSNVPQTSPMIAYRSQRMIQPLRSNSGKRTLSFYRTFINADASSRSKAKNQTTTDEPPASSLALRSKPTASSKRQDSARRHVLTELRLTKMLLAISLTCLSLNFPSYYLRFMFLYENSKGSSSNITTMSTASTTMVTTTTTTLALTSPSSSNKTQTNEIDFSFYRDVIFHYLSYLSYSINIVIYLLFGGNFRRALKRLFSLTSTNSEQLNARIRSTNGVHQEKTIGHSCEYDSTSVVTPSPNGSLRGNIKAPKARGATSRHRTLRQQQLLMNEQHKHSWTFANASIEPDRKYSPRHIPVIVSFSFYSHAKCLE